MKVIAAVFLAALLQHLSNVVSPTENRYNVTAQHLFNRQNILILVSTRRHMAALRWIDKPISEAVSRSTDLTLSVRPASSQASCGPRAAGAPIPLVMMGHADGHKRADRQLLLGRRLLE